MTGRFSSLQRSAKALCNQRGFTLAELMIALAVSAFLMTGALTLFSNMIIRTSEDQDKTMATLQVQYVGFWLGEDVVQAQRIDIPSYVGNVTTEGNCTVKEGDFKLEVYWVEWSGNENRITYSVEEMTDEFNRPLWKLLRTHELRQRGQSTWENYGTSIAGEYLKPGGMMVCEYCPEDTDMPEGTWYAYGRVDKLLKLKVVATVDQVEMSSIYKINPRAVPD
jgi:prepilin-type N-terminal cleavage/methylation domain-containing protein